MLRAYRTARPAEIKKREPNQWRDIASDDEAADLRNGDYSSDAARRLSRGAVGTIIVELKSAGPYIRDNSFRLTIDLPNAITKSGKTAERFRQNLG